MDINFGPIHKVQMYYLVRYSHCICSSEPEGVVNKGDEPDAATPTIEEALNQLGLEAHTEVFKKEQIDYESLVSLKCTLEVCLKLLLFVQAL